MNNVHQALRDLLDYTGGWDLEDEAHPIVRARRALEGERPKTVELHVTPEEARRLLELADADHDCNENPISKSAAKKIWRHLADAGLMPNANNNKQMRKP
jgi:hypothetical protein